jgi:phosphoribosylpyrophosphate synthetase
MRYLLQNKKAANIIDTMELIGEVKVKCCASDMIDTGGTLAKADLMMEKEH